MNATMKLVLLRHGESVWNYKNLFTGWADIELTDGGWLKANSAGKLLLKEGFDFDICYTSYLKRAIDTLHLVLEAMDRKWLPVVKSWKLNDRHYGALEGKNKDELAEIYGEEQVLDWQRNFNARPPLLEPGDERNPALQAPYRNVPPEQLPLGESLKDTAARALPFFQEVIAPQMKDGKRVLISAHRNALRGLVREFDKLSDEETVNATISAGVPLVYEFAPDFSVLGKKHLGKS